MNALVFLPAILLLSAAAAALWVMKNVGIVKCMLCGSLWTVRHRDTEKIAVYRCMKCGNESW